MKHDPLWWLPLLALLVVALSGFVASINIMRLKTRVAALEMAIVEQVHTREATP